jgi:hypothetical protein
VIPTLILFGLVVGRWWRSSLTVAAVGWPVMLIATGVMTWEANQLLGAAGLAIVNTGVGVLIHQGILRLSRKVRRGVAASRPGA